MNADGARLCVLLASIEDVTLRAGTAAREIEGLGAAALARVLSELVHAAAARSARAGVALAAVGAAIAAWPEERREALRAEALAIGLEDAAALLVSAAPLRSITPGDLRDPPGLEGVTLGHRKAWARGRSGDLLARLMGTGDPQVVRSALENGRITEAEVIRLAARRPVRADALVEIARSRRFGGRPAVRRAIVRNPYAPVELALSLVPLLLAPELRDVAADGSLHPAVREEALQVLASRGDRAGASARAAIERMAQERAQREAARREAAGEAGDLEADLLALCAQVEAGVTLTEIPDPDSGNVVLAVPSSLARDGAVQDLADRTKLSRAEDERENEDQDGELG